MHKHNRCQKQPERVTLLSQHGASAQEQEAGQVFSSWEKKGTLTLVVTHPTQSHGAPRYLS